MPRGRRARRPGRGHARRRRGGLRARLRRRLPRHRRGVARLRDRLREEARRQAGERRGGPRSRPCSATWASCPPIWTPHCWCWRTRRARWDAADVIERGVLANRAKYLATEVEPRRHVEGHPDRRRPRRLPGLPGRARLPRRPHVHADAADDGPDAGGHRQERARPRRGDVQHPWIATALTTAHP